MPSASTIDAALRAHADRSPESVALVAGDTRLTYAELDAAIDHACRELHRRGLRHGDRVALHAPNSAPFVITLYAVMRAGGIAVPLNPASAVAERDHVLGDSGASIVVPATGMASPAPTPGRNPVSPSDAPAPRPGDDALILYTSGTTGRPKGALFDHARVWAAARSAAMVADLTSDDRVLIVAPLYHAAALGVLLFSAAVSGATAVIEPGFGADATPEALDRHGATVFFGVPTMYQVMLRDNALAARDLSRLRLALFGGSAMPVHTIHDLAAAVPNTALMQLCGQTEGGPGGIYSTPAQVAARPDSSGHRAMPGSEIRIEPRDGIPGGATGELLLRGPSVMKGYWRNPTATSAALVDGWLRTGDIVRADPDGALTIVDRSKDVILAGGHTVFSAEVEHAIAALPMVSCCAVYGAPHPIYGQTVVAAIEPMPGAAITVDSLRASLADSLAGYKLPRLLTLRQLPRTAGGKVDKVALRREHGDQL